MFDNSGQYAWLRRFEQFQWLRQHSNADSWNNLRKLSSLGNRNQRNCENINNNSTVNSINLTFQTSVASPLPLLRPQSFEVEGAEGSGQKALDAGLIPSSDHYSFEALSQLRKLRDLQANASISARAYGRR
jgi:hypothetical protein